VYLYIYKYIYKESLLYKLAEFVFPIRTIEMIKTDSFELTHFCFCETKL